MKNALDIRQLFWVFATVACGYLLVADVLATFAAAISLVANVGK